MIRYPQTRPALLSLLLAISVFSPSLGAVSNKATSSESRNGEATVLTLGSALVDRERGRILSANPAGKGTAHALIDGKLLWQSNEVSVPVFSDGGLIYAIGTAKGPGVGQLLVLDADSGVIKQRINLSFPDKVFPNPIAGPARQLKLHAVTQGNVPVLHWQYRSQALKGALEHESDLEITEFSGAFEISRSAEQVVSVQGGAAEFVTLAATELFGSDRLAEQAGRQFQSADTTVVSVSQARADTTFGALYQWRLLDRGNGEALAQLSLPVSSAPFVVADAIVLVQLPAMAYVQSGKSEIIGNHLQAIRLSDQKPLFRIELLAPSYQGPMPP